MAINKSLDEASVTSMITGFLSNQKDPMNKINRRGATKKVEKFWKGINESISLFEARDVIARHPQTGEMHPATVVGATSPKGGRSLFKVAWKDASLGEPVVLSGDKIKFERLPMQGEAPTQTVSVGQAKPGEVKLSDESDPQAQSAPESWMKRLPTEEEQSTSAPSPEEKDLPQTSRVVKSSEKTGKMKQSMTGVQLREKVNKRIGFFLNSSPDFKRKYTDILDKIKSGDEGARKELFNLRGKIASDIEKEMGVSRKSASQESLSQKGGSQATSERFVKTIAKKFLDAVAPDLKAGKMPAEDLFRMGKGMFGIEFRKPSDVGALMTLLGGQEAASPEAVSAFVEKFAKNLEGIRGFASARLDAFPGSFVDKIERAANIKNIPSEFERGSAGEPGGIGSGAKKIVPIPFEDKGEALTRENILLKKFLTPKQKSVVLAALKQKGETTAREVLNKIIEELNKQSGELKGKVFSRSKVGSTPVFKAAEELPIEDVARLFSYFSQNTEEVERAQKERINKTGEFSSGKLPEPGASIDKLSTIGSKVPTSILTKSERERVSDEAQKQKGEFRKGAQSRLDALFSQTEDDEPVSSGPSFKTSPKNIPSPKDLWSRVVNVNADKNPFVRKLISVAAKTFSADEEDVQEVLRALLKTDARGNVVGLRNPQKEPVDLPSDESGNLIHPEDSTIAAKLFYALDPSRLQTKSGGSKVEKVRQLAPAFEEFGKAEAEKVINLPSLEKHIGRLQRKEAEEESAKEKELSDLRRKRVSPEEIEDIETREATSRSKLADQIKNYVSSIRNEDGTLNPEFVRKYVEPENYKLALEMLKNAKDLDLESDPEMAKTIDKMRKMVERLHSFVPAAKTMHLPPTTLRATKGQERKISTPSGKEKISKREIDKPTGKLVHPKSPDVDYEKMPQVKDFIGPEFTDTVTDPDAADPEKALAKYKSEEESGIPKAQRSFTSRRYGSPQHVGSKYSTEPTDEVKIRRLKGVFAAAKKHVGKQGVPLTKLSVLRSMKRIIEKNPKFEDLKSVTLNKELLSKLQESTNMKLYKMSLFEFLTIPGEKKLSHAELKEKEWDAVNPVSKKKFAPEFEKQTMPSVKTKKKS